MNPAIAPGRVSLARRTTRRRISPSIDGRPRRLGYVHRRRTRPGCQRSSVAGRTNRHLAAGEAAAVRDRPGPPDRASPPAAATPSAAAPPPHVAAPEARRPSPPSPERSTPPTASAARTSGRPAATPSTHHPHHVRPQNPCSDRTDDFLAPTGSGVLVGDRGLLSEPGMAADG